MNMARFGIIQLNSHSLHNHVIFFFSSVIEINHYLTACETTNVFSVLEKRYSVTNKFWWLKNSNKWLLCLIWFDLNWLKMAFQCVFQKNIIYPIANNSHGSYRQYLPNYLNIRMIIVFDWQSKCSTSQMRKKEH